MQPPIASRRASFAALLSLLCTLAACGDGSATITTSEDDAFDQADLATELVAGHPSEPDFSSSTLEMLDDGEAEILEDAVAVDDEPALVPSADTLVLTAEEEAGSVEITAEALAEPGTLESALTAAQTKKKAPAAIAWYSNRKGSRAYEGLCLKAARLAYKGKAGRFPSALSLWNWSVKKKRAYKNQNPPLGAYIFWRTSSNGHVAVSTGSGKTFWSTSVGGKIGKAKLVYFKKYLGWAYPPW